jgi:hypothetical protein
MAYSTFSLSDILSQVVGSGGMASAFWLLRVIRAIKTILRAIWGHGVCPSKTTLRVARSFEHYNRQTLADFV